MWVPGIKARPVVWWAPLPAEIPLQPPLWQYHALCVCAVVYVYICVFRYAMSCVCICIWRLEVNLKSPPPFSSHACMANTLLTQQFPSSTFLLCLRTKPMASYILRMCSTIELHSHPSVLLLWGQFSSCVPCVPSLGALAVALPDGVKTTRSAHLALCLCCLLSESVFVFCGGLWKSVAQCRPCYETLALIHF